VAEIFLSIGTNLGDKKQNLEWALAEINVQIGEINSCSSIYESKPWGFDTKEYFFNIMIKLTTTMNPEELLKNCQAIENKMGRIRDGKIGYTSRVIDIDIIYYEEQIVRSPQLKIPHPLLHERNFVLAPLCEIAPTKLHPLFLMDSTELLKNCTDTINAIRRTDLNLGIH
jgi:2-amino-4-hydroxy-6-hydroxymethyldihydropteridine diphosphokinase